MALRKQDILRADGVPRRAAATTDGHAGGAHRPCLLLLGDFTSAADPPVCEVLSLVCELAATGTTILMAMPRGASRGRSRTGGASGRMVESGPPDEILGKPVEALTRQFVARLIDAGRLATAVDDGRDVVRYWSRVRAGLGPTPW